MEEKDYKKLYEDVVALAKDGLKDGLYLSQSAKAVTEFLFPQLKETEEEKARKGLVRFLINFNNGCYSKPSETEIDAWIKWINKKCEQKPVECIKFDNEFENQISHLIASVLNGEHEYNEGFVKYASQSLLGFANKDQNHTDKVKPKFKVGDWVVYNRDDSSREIIQVYDIRDGRYYFNDNIHFSWSVKECDEKCHLWTIQDAKDGDVLHSIGWHNDCIFIFNGLDNWKFDEPNGDRAVATAYCCLSVSADNMEFGMQGPDCIEVNTVKPAPKIQRDLLFAKMKEAGYEWDADKKELKKLEQKSTDKVEPKFKIDDWVVCDSDIDRVERITDRFYHFESGDCGLIKDVDEDYHLWTIQDAKDGDVLANGDVNIVLIFKCFAEPSYKQHIIAHIGLDASGDIQVTDEYWNLGFDCGKPATKEQRDLLFQKMKEAGYEWDAEKKELRKIEQKSSWSEEDEKMKNLIISTLTSMGTLNLERYHHMNLDEVKNWLKSLKNRVQSQPKQEWSEEDEHCIELLLPIIDSSSLIPKNRKKCKEFLKSLKSGHWKPSEEQLTALKNAIIGKRGPLYDLYFDLEKL